MTCSSHFLIYGRVLGLLEVPKSDPGGLRLVAYASESAASLPRHTIALPRASALRSNWRDDLRVVPNLSRKAASLIMAASPQMWALTTEPPGGVEEAHRRWPEGRSERGASKAKHRPPVVFREALPRQPRSAGVPPAWVSRSMARSRRLFSLGLCTSVAFLENQDVRI
jgi:hypothetical protein